MQFGRIIISALAQVTMLTWAAIGIGAVVAIVYFGIFFKSWDDFQDAWSDFWRGLFRRQFAPRMSFWLIISIGSGMLAYYQLPDWFPHLFGSAK